MTPKLKTPHDSSVRSLHSASQFGRPSRSPFPEPGKQLRDEAMSALKERLKRLNEETTKHPD